MSEKKDITVEAEIEVTTPEGTRFVRTFSRAWAATVAGPFPARGHFSKWARVEKK